MDFKALRRFYLVLSYVRSHLPLLFSSIGLSEEVDLFSRLDSDLKSLMTLIDDFILEHE